MDKDVSSHIQLWFWEKRTLTADVLCSLQPLPCTHPCYPLHRNPNPLLPRYFAPSLILQAHLEGYMLSEAFLHAQHSSFSYSALAHIYDCFYVSLNDVSGSVTKSWKLRTLPALLLPLGNCQVPSRFSYFSPYLLHPGQCQHCHQRDHLQMQIGFIILPCLERALKEDLNQNWEIFSKCCFHV